MDQPVRLHRIIIKGAVQYLLTDIVLFFSGITITTERGILCVKIYTRETVLYMVCMKVI